MAFPNTSYLFILIYCDCNKGWAGIVDAEGSTFCICNTHIWPLMTISQIKPFAKFNEQSSAQVKTESHTVYN